MKVRNLAQVTVHSKVYFYVWTKDYKLIYYTPEGTRKVYDSSSQLVTPSEPLTWIGKRGDKRGFGVWNKKFAAEVIEFLES